MRFAFLLCCGLFACTTKDGQLVSLEPGTGGLVVQASVGRGRIFIDYRDTGKEAPALITDLAPGRHVVHLFLAGHSVIPDSHNINITAGGEARVEFELRQSSSVGTVQINSTPAGALVRVNRLPFGRTPLTIAGLASGDHELTLHKGGYEPVRQSVRIRTNQTTELKSTLVLRPALTLVEHFSNTDCAPCPEADRIIEAVLVEKGVDSAAVISYHPDFPGRQDPMFLAAPADNLSRYGFYNRPPLPFVVVDGVRRLAGTSNLAVRFRSALAGRSDRQPVALLDFEDFAEVQQSARALNGKVRVEALADLAGQNAVLHLALIEREVAFAVAPGSNGQKRFFDVMRAFYPNAEGRVVALAPGASAVFAFAFARKTEWTGVLQVVAFVQNSVTGEVLQALWSAAD
ncbi:MAG: PEGA domain-containing protein [candidate division KSB1 bacterium]|nr:PEGA domain-containing protein [candidate division KSB1 bacterium]MDZ7275415.1 PEGA domain-containing protein [candidate division KSB1 bacterium]MDZ7286273.1 PEGA domain-containing protein [candidate division KSB1 bacterium]MDZ7296499.1 PEGA domain-containing protein [candidate division KSB1 bacterium]MDZ7305543.1 PEGA domain-containing protein [candidate division KSB1 bacterium]